MKVWPIITSTAYDTDMQRMWLAATYLSIKCILPDNSMGSQSTTFFIKHNFIASECEIGPAFFPVDCAVVGRDACIQRGDKVSGHLLVSSDKKKVIHKAHQQLGGREC